MSVSEMGKTVALIEEVVATVFLGLSRSNSFQKSVKLSQLYIMHCMAWKLSFKKHVHDLINKNLFPLLPRTSSFFCSWLPRLGGISNLEQYWTKSPRIFPTNKVLLIFTFTFEITFIYETCFKSSNGSPTRRILEARLLNCSFYLTYHAAARVIFEHFKLFFLVARLIGTRPTRLEIPERYSI